jgi:YD repeat-containing protein
VVYPNLTDAAPGAWFDFLDYDPVAKGWHLYGRGQVSADGRQVIPGPGVAFYRSMGSSITVTGGPPSSGPPCPPDPPVEPEPGEGAPGGDEGDEGSPGGDEGDQGGSGGEGGNDNRADPVSCASGMFVLIRTDVQLRDLLPVRLTRTYHSGDTTTRPFGKGATHPYAMYLYAPTSHQYMSTEVVAANGTKIAYTRISPGTGYEDAVMEHVGTPSAYHKSRLSFRRNPDRWELALTDGTVYEFSAFGSANLVAVRDRFGNRLDITRSGGNVTRITTPSGRYIDFTYDGSGRITQAKDIAQRTWTYQYDAAG